MISKKLIILFLLIAMESYANQDYIEFDRINQLDEQNKVLISKLEELEHEIAKNKVLFNKAIEDLKFRTEELEKSQKNNLSIIETKIKNSTENSSLNNANNLYNQAFQYVKDGKYKLARSSFQDFIQKFKNNPLVGNAYYWMGETYYAEKNYEKAAVNFINSYKKFPEGTKAVNSLYKLGNSLRKLGKNKDACNAYLKLSDYKNIPQSIGKHTNEVINILHCKK